MNESNSQGASESAQPSDAKPSESSSASTDSTAAPNQFAEILQQMTTQPASKPRRPVDTSDWESTAPTSLEETFDGLAPPRKKRRRKTPAIRVQLRVVAIEDTETELPELKEEVRQPLVFQTPLEGPDDDFDIFDDPFFEETHEEEDPDYKVFHLRNRQESLKNRLAQLDQQDVRERKNIDELVAEHLKERQAATVKSIEAYIQKSKEDEKSEIDKLVKYFQEKAKSNQAKINDSIQVFHQRHATELQKALQQHRHSAQQRRLSDQAMQSEWQTINNQLQQKQHQQLKDFHGKAEEVRKKHEADFRREQQRLRAVHEAKRQKVDGNRQKMFSKLYSHFQQQHQRYIKRHMAKVAKRRQELQEELRQHKSVKSLVPFVSTRDMVKTAIEYKEELRPPSPIKSLPEWTQASGLVKSGGALRHRHRKGVLNQTKRQLTVELHNEGIWVCTVATTVGENGEKQETLTEQEFLPWGIQANLALESILCGEIPRDFEKYASADAVVVQSGQLRCVITDLRTSEDTASDMRVESMKEQEASDIEQLEANLRESNRLLTEAETVASAEEKKFNDVKNSLTMIVKNLEMARKTLEGFRTKYASYLGPNGEMIQTQDPKHHESLTKALQRYEAQVKTAGRKEELARKLASDSQARLHKAQLGSKAAQHTVAQSANLLKRKRSAAETQSSSGSSDASSGIIDLEAVAYRVRNVMGALRRTAAERRVEANMKKNSSTSSAWVQSMPDLSAALKKSLWHRMHRRKQQIVLRPSEESMINGLRASIKNAVTQYKKKHLSRKHINVEDQVNKAESLFLLCTHPASQLEEGLPSVPSNKADEWAEPGWQLRLDVQEEASSGILPRAPAYRLLESNVSEMSSAPGRQAASMMRSSFLRCLEAPLSKFLVASSPAESSAGHATKPAGLSQATDPLAYNETDIEEGYRFSLQSMALVQSSLLKRQQEEQSETMASRKSAPTPVTARAAQNPVLAERSAPNLGFGAVGQTPLAPATNGAPLATQKTGRALTNGASAAVKSAAQQYSKILREQSAQQALQRQRHQVQQQQAAMSTTTSQTKAPHPPNQQRAPSQSSISSSNQQRSNSNVAPQFQPATFQQQMGQNYGHMFYNPQIFPQMQNFRMIPPFQQFQNPQQQQGQKSQTQQMPPNMNYSQAMMMPRGLIQQRHPSAPSKGQMQRQPSSTSQSQMQRQQSGSSQNQAQHQQVQRQQVPTPQGHMQRPPANPMIAPAPINIAPANQAFVRPKMAPQPAGIQVRSAKPASGEQPANPNDGPKPTNPE